MRIALLTGLGAGVLCGFMHFYKLTGASDAMGGFLHYAPLLIFFAGVYFSIKRTSTVKFNGQIGFKEALKVGTVAALIMAIFCGIGYYVALSYTDVRGEINFMKEQGMTNEEIQTTLGHITRQVMFDRSKFFAIEYLLMGFILSGGIAFIMKVSRRKQSQ